MAEQSAQSNQESNMNNMNKLLTTYFVGQYSWYFTLLCCIYHLKLKLLKIIRFPISFAETLWFYILFKYLEVHKLYAFSLETHKPNCKLATLLWTFLPFLLSLTKPLLSQTSLTQNTLFAFFCSVWQTWYIVYDW